MAKGDSGKAQNMIDSQQVLAQNYLSQLQQQNQMLTQLATGQMYGSPGQDVTNRTGQQSSEENDQIINYINTRKAQLPPTKESLQTIVDELNKQGIPVKFDTHAGGTLQSDDKILFPDGTGYDAINNVGGSNASWGDLNSPYKINGKDVSSDNTGGAAGQANADYKKILDQYGEFAKTGGFSPEDLAAIRSRAVSPIRSVYSSAENAVERQKALQGGYSPNYTAAMAKMAREQSQATSDATTNAEANIAGMKQAGRLSGLGGQASMYGTTPGLASMYGNQMLGLAGQGMQAGGLQNQLSNSLMQNQINKAGVPSTYSQVLGNIGGTAKVAGGIIAPWL